MPQLTCASCSHRFDVAAAELRDLAGQMLYCPACGVGKRLPAAAAAIPVPPPVGVGSANLIKSPSASLAAAAQSPATPGGQSAAVSRQNWRPWIAVAVAVAAGMPLLLCCGSGVAIGNRLGWFGTGGLPIPVPGIAMTNEEKAKAAIRKEWRDSGIEEIKWWSLYPLKNSVHVRQPITDDGYSIRVKYRVPIGLGMTKVLDQVFVLRPDFSTKYCVSPYYFRRPGQTEPDPE